MRIFHRIDDIGIYDEQIVEIINFFETNTKEYILAVVPKQLSDDLAQVIKTLKRGTIYQHGFQHKNRIPKGWCNEFPDSLGYDEIIKEIKTGKELIESKTGKKIDGYTPPWNNTGIISMNILKELGFATYSSQENNTMNYENKKDICVDVVKEYIPKIVYKDFESVFSDVEMMVRENKQTIGIMYHFNKTDKDQLERIKKFVCAVERFNEVVK